MGNRELMKEYNYTECGLENVYLANGYNVVDGPRGKQVVINDIDGLHQAIGRYLVNNKRDLTGKELRFLRHEMQMSQATVALLLDVAEQTVHRWEAKKTSVPKTAEVLIRLLYNEHLNHNEKIQASLKRIASIEDEIDRTMRFHIQRGVGWQGEPRRAA